MSLASLLDKAAPLHFSQMDYFAVRDTCKELVKLAASETLMTKEAEALSETQHETAMKVVHVGLANDSPNSSAYFKWHAHLYDVCGPGVIMRVLSDKPAITTVD